MKEYDAMNLGNVKDMGRSAGKEGMSDAKQYSSKKLSVDINLKMNNKKGNNKIWPAIVKMNQWG